MTRPTQGPIAVGGRWTDLRPRAANGLVAGVLRKRFRLVPAMALIGVAIIGSALMLPLAGRQTLRWIEELRTPWRVLRTRWRLAKARAIPTA